MQDLNDPNMPTAGGGDTYPDQANLSGAHQAADPFNGYEDYFDFDERGTWYFPDGKQYIEFKKLNEGERAKYLKATRSDVHLNQKSGEARIPFDQSNDRMELLLHSITNWNLMRRDLQTGNFVPVAFPLNSSSKGGGLAQWIQKANPAILGQLEKSIRMANPWLMNEMSVEQIDKEIADLNELRKVAEERELAEGNSSSK